MGRNVNWLHGDGRDWECKNPFPVISSTHRMYARAVLRVTFQIAEAIQSLSSSNISRILLQGRHWLECTWRRIRKSYTASHFLKRLPTKCLLYFTDSCVFQTSGSISETVRDNGDCKPYNCHRLPTLSTTRRPSEGATENARHENAGPNCRGGNCGKS